MKTSKKSFTLVELILVIAIMSILAVALFMLLTKWVWHGKDARRIRDLKIIKDWLEIDYIELNKYPLPSNKHIIKDSDWNPLWYMWVFGEETIKNSPTLQKAPIDPRDKSYFFYATTLNQKNFQMWTIFENSVEVGHTNVKNITKVAQIKWFYDGYIWYSTWDNHTIIQIDSILAYTWNGIISNLSGNVYNFLVQNKQLWASQKIRNITFSWWEDLENIVNKAVNNFIWVNEDIAKIIIKKHFN